MKKEKKLYSAPKVNRVKLVVKNAILGSCHSSPVQTPRRARTCNLEPSCWFGPGR